MLDEMPESLIPPKVNRTYSIGAVCQLLQVTPAQVAVLMEDAAIRFAGMHDAVPFIDELALETLTKRCVEIRGEIQQVKDSVANN